METESPFERLLAYLQQLPSFRCIDLQCVEEENHLYVRATVGSAWDRTRLITALSDTLETGTFTHMILIDPLLSTPFSPTLPCRYTKENAPDMVASSFLLGGEQLTSAREERH